MVFPRHTSGHATGHKDFAAHIRRTYERLVSSQQEWRRLIDRLNRQPTQHQVSVSPFATHSALTTRTTQDVAYSLDRTIRASHTTPMLERGHWTLVVVLRVTGKGRKPTLLARTFEIIGEKSNYRYNSDEVFYFSDLKSLWRLRYWAG